MVERAEQTTRVMGLFGASILLHAALVVLLGSARLPPAAPPQRALQVAVVEKPAPARTPRRPARDFPPPPTRPQAPVPPAPPPPSQEEQETTQQPVVLPGITLESTSQGGSFAVSTGNTLYGEPPRTATEPGVAKPYKAERYVAASQVNELPSVASRPDTLRPFYPDVAKQRGVQGDVVLRLLVDADGSLAKVDIVSEPGEGLGAAGTRAIRQFRFRPGKVNGQPVATTITYVLHFVLD